MLSCHLRGGLGNQLFQVFTTISYALQFQTSFFFFESSSSITYWNTFFSKLKPFLRPSSSIPLLTFINEPSFIYHGNIIGNKIQENKNTYTSMLVGYFQSYKYFDTYKHQITRFINKNVSLNIQIDYENTISMHFRFGDYKQLTNIYHILDENYYSNAIQYLQQQHNNLTNVLYFYEPSAEDDVNHIIQILQIKFPHIDFQPCNPLLQDYEQLLVMSACKYNIIANSTFSWWAAYLNNNVSNIVCYPSKWFSNNISTQDLFPNHWIQIDM